ncbi:uncharacterized protein E0L32_003158 [Thyridium curvatum]|uniref:Uncharacterized protein n=1 Tax=Thyridium curvatum TaxID=1093900 RepID=A0A507B329_9PEZI|nr:uncharacterized protein E0L32_003158 [Thyridium curvatum]TPX17515.1 hypothetical protein E0L32_003158 [Thyridium curvatum]
MAKWALALKAVAAACLLGAPGASAWTQQELNASRRPAPAVAGPVVPGRFIVELEPGTQSRQRDLAARATTLLGDMKSKGMDAEVKTDYSAVSGRFQGVSVEITNNKNASIDDIKAIPGVADVWPVYSIALDDTVNTADPSPKWNPHISTRVDELHKRGLTGRGQRVCVVDSGVDASHPALTGKVTGGKNLIDDTRNFEDCLGHGTFVSSVIAGSTKDLTGVAPGAEIFMYKVFGCENKVSNDLVLKGLLSADADACDIISMSLGSDIGYSGSILSRMASQIAKDRLVIIAAGNKGEIGPFYASSPASGRGVVSVASTDARQMLGWPATIVSSSGETFNLSYVTPDGSKLNESVTAPITLDPGDSCNPEKYGRENQAVLVQRGICFIGKSYNFLTSSGFGYYLIFDTYNQGVGYMSDVVNWNPSVHLFALTGAPVGAWVKKQVAAQYNLTLQIEIDANTAAFASDQPSAGQMSYFSSWGPSFENDFSPSVAAPGGLVYGAYPNNKFAVGSGTSFSTPYVAGVAALFYAHVKKDFAEFSRRLSSTAALLPAYSAAQKQVLGNVAPLAQQGAGLIDAVKVLDYRTVITSDRQISLNDTDNRVNTHTIRLQNTGDKAVTYKISHLPAATVQSRDKSLYPYVYYPPLLSGVEGSIVAPESITIAAGSTQDVVVTFNSPANSDGNSGAVWSGKVVFRGDNDEAVSVPYMGVQVSTYNWTPLEGAPLAFRYDTRDGYLYPVDWQSRPYKPAEYDSPEIYFALRYGTYEFSLDLVGQDYTTADFSYPLKAGPESNQWRGPLRTQPDVWGSFVDFPSKFALRFNNVGFNKFQSFANGTKIPSGRYRILSRALRMFGDATNPKDWQLFLSDPFSIQLGNDPIPGLSTSSSASSTASPTSTGGTTTVPTTTSATTTTTISSASATTTSVPGITTTLTAVSQPTGLANAFVDLSLYRKGTQQSPDLFDTNSWLEIHVQISIPTRLYEGTTVSFALPRALVDVAQSSYVMSPGSMVGTAVFDKNSSLYTVTFNDWATWHKNIVGDFYIAARLDPAFQKEMVAGTYVVEMATVGKTFYQPIYYRAIDRSRVYEYAREVPSNDGNKLFAFNVEVPGSIGPWKSVTFASSQTSGDDGFRCDQTRVNLGTSFDASNRIVESTDVTNQTVKRCEVKAFRAVYDGAIPKEEVLQFNMINMLGMRGYKSISMPYSLAVELQNGTAIGFNLRTMNYDMLSRSRPDNWFNGVVDQSGPIGGGTTTSSSMSSTATSTSSSTSTSETSTSVTITSATSTGLGNSTTSSFTSTVTSVTSTSANSTSVPTTAPVSSSSASSSSASSSSISSSSTETTTAQSTASSSSSSSTVISTTGGNATSTASSTSTSASSSTMSSSSSTLSSSSSASGSSTVSTSGTASSSSISSSASTASSSSTGSSSSAPISSPTSQPPSSSSRPQTTSPTTSPTASSSAGHTSSSTVPSSSSSISSTRTTGSSGSSTTKGPSSISSSQPPHQTSASTKSITSIVTVITTVCTDPSWTSPVTVTYTVPCATEPNAPITTVTSVCTVCASHPVTLTYTQPVVKPALPSEGTRGPAVVTYGSRTIDLGGASQAPAQPSVVTIPTVGNGGGRPSGDKSASAPQPSKASTPPVGGGSGAGQTSGGAAPPAGSSARTSAPAGSSPSTPPVAAAASRASMGVFASTFLGFVIAALL